LFTYDDDNSLEGFDVFKELRLANASARDAKGLALFFSFFSRKKSRSEAEPAAARPGAQIKFKTQFRS